MCGIVAYLGERDAFPILINGLKRLEYRGYDSAGVALFEGDELKIYKCQGKVSDLEAHVNGRSTKGSIGMGHTRWATHGAPNPLDAAYDPLDNNMSTLTNTLTQYQLDIIFNGKIEPNLDKDVVVLVPGQDQTIRSSLDAVAVALIPKLAR